MQKSQFRLGLGLSPVMTYNSEGIPRGILVRHLLSLAISKLNVVRTLFSKIFKWEILDYSFRSKKKCTCVLQPVESFTIVFASAALVVNEWKKEGMILQKPIASISWLGRTV